MDPRCRHLRLLRRHRPRAIAGEAADLHEDDRTLAQGRIDRQGCLARQRGRYAAGRNSLARIGECSPRWDGAPLRRRGPRRQPRQGRDEEGGMDKSVVLIRYADDVLVTAPSKEVLERHVLPRLAAFLADRGLVLNHAKTRIVSIDAGFDFLGFTARKFRDGKLLIRPAKTKVLAHLRAIKAYLDAKRQAPAGAVVRALAPVIRGWTLYYRHACSARTFSYADHRVWQMLWAWARRRHPT